MKDYKTRLYRIWQKMKSRCYNKNNAYYHRYGGRGIKVYDEWVNNFPKFKEWSLSHNYNDYLTIDRINNDGNYEPDNCRWTTMKVQANNTSHNFYITYKNETKTLAQWAEILHINKNTLHIRITVKHWSVEKAFNTPIKKKIVFETEEEKTKYEKLQKHKYYETHKKELLVKNKKYYENNKKHILEMCRIYRKNHIEDYKKNNKIWRENNKEYKKQQDNLYRKSHTEEIAIYKRNWYEKNRKKQLNKDSRLCKDPRNAGNICTYRSLKIFASRHKDSPLVNNESPTKWAEQFLIEI